MRIVQSEYAHCAVRMCALCSQSMHCAVRMCALCSQNVRIVQSECARRQSECVRSEYAWCAGTSECDSGQSCFWFSQVAFPQYQFICSPSMLVCPNAAAWLSWLLLLLIRCTILAASLTPWLSYPSLHCPRCCPHSLACQGTSIGCMNATGNGTRMPNLDHCPDERPAGFNPLTMKGAFESNPTGMHHSCSNTHLDSSLFSAYPTKSKSARDRNVNTEKGRDREIEREWEIETQTQTQSLHVCRVWRTSPKHEDTFTSGSFVLDFRDAHRLHFCLSA